MGEEGKGEGRGRWCLLSQQELVRMHVGTKTLRSPLHAAVGHFLTMEVLCKVRTGEGREREKGGEGVFAKPTRPCTYALGNQKVFYKSTHLVG